MIRICRECGNEVRRVGARFCGKCGGKLQRPLRRWVAFLGMPLVGAAVAAVWLHLSAGAPDGGAASAPASAAMPTVGTPASAAGPVSLEAATTIATALPTPSGASVAP